MRVYSFTKPGKKPLFKEDTKLWLIFIVISFFLYLLFALLLVIKAYFFKQDTGKLLKEIDHLKKETIELNLQKEFIYTQKAIQENLNVKNALTKQQIKNLLDLIPDPITLDKFYMDHNKLIIYGITPTKDIYNLLMLPPLQSIFVKTITNFYELPNGWYKFKSENFIKEESNETKNN